MLKRYSTFMIDNPLPAWALSVAVLVSLSRAVTWLFPGGNGPEMFRQLACTGVFLPSVQLMVRFSERRESPVSSAQEQGVARLSLVASVFGLLAVLATILGRWRGWPVNLRFDLLMVSLVAALISLPLGAAVRETRAGRGALRLTFAALLLLGLYVVVMLFLRAAHAGG